MYAKDVPAGTIFYHGTKADLQLGGLLCPGFDSNFAARSLKHIYFTATLEAATWGAELARGEGRGKIYTVEPAGNYEDHPNLTDKKFPASYCILSINKSTESDRRGKKLGWPKLASSLQRWETIWPD